MAVVSLSSPSVSSPSETNVLFSALQDSLEMPMFVIDRLNPATHQLPPTSYLLTPPLPAGLYTPCASVPQPAYLSLPQPSSLTLECLQPHNPFSRL